jgi:hypothetical protein
MELSALFPAAIATVHGPVRIDNFLSCSLALKRMYNSLELEFVYPWEGDPARRHPRAPRAPRVGQPAPHTPGRTQAMWRSAARALPRITRPILAAVEVSKHSAEQSSSAAAGDAADPQRGEFYTAICLADPICPFYDTLPLSSSSCLRQPLHSTGRWCCCCWRSAGRAHGRVTWLSQLLSG